MHFLKLKIIPNFTICYIFRNENKEEFFGKLTFSEICTSRTSIISNNSKLIRPTLNIYIIYDTKNIYAYSFTCIFIRVLGVERFWFDFWSIGQKFFVLTLSVITLKSSQISVKILF